MAAPPSHPYRTRRPLTAAAAAVLLALVSACGGSDGSAETASGASSETSPETSQASPQTSPTATAPAPATSGPSAPQDGQSPAPAEQAVIRISDFTFSTPASVAPGSEVTVMNEDSSFHTVTAVDGAFDVAAPSGTVTFTAPDEPGEYAFACTPHPNMTGTLVVA